jgi:glyoxylate reductase
MKELFDVELNESDTPMSKPELVSAMNRADVLVPCIADRIDAGMLGQAGDKLKLIANYGAGVDHIDVSTARQRGILVSNTPGVMTDDTADMVMALMLSVLRRLPEGMAVMQEGNWAGWAPTAFMGGRVGGKRLGILGMGRIGQAVARRAQVFGMQVHYHNRRRLHPETEAELEATYWESLDQMIARMDVISVNCPHTPSTFHLMNARRLKLMKKDAVIVNTSRGEVIDENALTRMLRSGRDRGRGARRVREGARGEPAPARAAERGAAAAHGVGHARGPRGDGREGDHQHQDLRRRSPAARHGRALDVVRGVRTRPERPARRATPADVGTPRPGRSGRS